MTSLNRSLLADAAMYGIIVSAAAETDDQDPGITYTVRGPGDRSTAHQDADDAAREVHARITAVDDAERAADERAQEWSATVHDHASYRELARAVNDELPAGCSIPLPPTHDMYSVDSLPPLTVAVANAMAQWAAEQRDQAARTRLQEAVEAEGAEIREAEGYSRPLHVPYWESRVELWRPVLLAGDIGESPTIRRGRVQVAEGTVREIAWHHYGIVLPVGRDAVDDAADQIDRAQMAVRKAVKNHQAAAERLSGRLGV